MQTIECICVEWVWYCHLAEATGQVADAQVSLHHDNGILDCKTSITCVRIVEPLFCLPQDSHCFIVKVAVDVWTAWEHVIRVITEVVSVFFVVCKTQPPRQLMEWTCAMLMISIWWLSEAVQLCCMAGSPINIEWTTKKGLLCFFSWFSPIYLQPGMLT